jgi:phospholipase C
VVVVVMENRTTDHLLGGLGLPATRPAGPPCRHPVLGNSHALAVAGLPHPGRRCAAPAAALPVTAALVRAGCVAVAHFSEVLGPSDPNHLALMAAASPIVENLGWRPRLPLLPTLADRLAAAGLTWRNYAGAPGAGFAMFPHLRRAAGQPPWWGFAADARRGDLPHLAWLTPPFSRGGHPPMPLAWAERWLGEQVVALAAGGGWAESALIVVWDDWGGFWDHVTPPVVARWRDGTPFRYGLRTPLLLLGGRVRPGTVYHRPCAHASIPAFVTRLFGLEPLGGWDVGADDLLAAWSGAGAPPPASLPLPPAPGPLGRGLQAAFDAAAGAWRALHTPRA